MVTLAGLICLTPSPDAQATEAEARIEIAQGDMAWEAGTVEEALRHYQAAIESSPDLAIAHGRLGVALFTAGRREEAIAALERAVALDPHHARTRLDLALAYLAQGDLFWAADELREAGLLAPGDPEIAYHEGLVLIDLGENEAGMERLALAAGDPALEPKARYHLGIALATSEQREEGQLQLEQARDASPSSPHGQAAGRALNLLIQQGWDTLPFFSGRLALKAQYDSNVVQEPIEVSRPLGADAPGLELRALLTVAPISTLAHTLYATLTVSRIQHLASPPDQFNHTGVSLAGGTSYRFAALGHTHTLGLHHRYDLGMLDGGELTDVDEFYAFREANTLTAEYALSRQGQYLATVELRYRNAVFADMRRDSNTFLARLSETLMFLSERFKVIFAAGFQYDQAHGDGYDLWGLNGSAGISALGPWSLQFLATVRFEHADHYHSAYYYGWGAGRQDDAVIVSTAIRRPLYDALLAELAWVHTERRSTTPAFDYRRDLVALTASWVFP
ncbi:MAG: tetratricopeptide repeat protein [Bradymonadales bacterium]|nr:tetratricopeptide repeat protein [Bradymonadales bacterium]